MHDDDRTIEELCRPVGVAESIQQAPRKGRRHMKRIRGPITTSQEIREIRELRAQGLTIRAIARRIGRSIGTVHKVSGGWEPDWDRIGAPKGNRNAVGRRNPRKNPP